MYDYIFIDGINSNDCVFSYNRLNNINYYLLKCASTFKQNGLKVSYIHYDTDRHWDFTKHKNKHSKYIININRYNNHAVAALIHELNVEDENVVVLSFNDNLSDFIGCIKSYKYVNYDENNSETKNLNELANACGISLNSYPKEILYCINKTFQNKTVNLTIGSGCERNCSFCNIKTKKVEYKETIILQSELKSLFNKGVRYFHVPNHFFANDASFVQEFCKMFLENFSQNDFVWSCFIIPETFVHHVNILPIMYKAGLRKIIIGTESVDSTIQNDLNIPENGMATKKIVEYAVKCGIVAIDINLIIGSSNESEHSLKVTENFVFELLDLSNGLCDIRFKYFHSKQCYQPTSLAPFNSPQMPLHHPLIKNIRNWTYDITHRIEERKKSFCPKLQLEYRHKIFKLKDYGIYTDLFLLCLCKSALQFTCQPYQYFSYNHSWDELQNCSPILSNTGTISDDGCYVFYLDKCLQTKDVEKVSFPSESGTLFNLLNQKMKLSQIIRSLEGTMNESEIKLTLDTLENNHMLCYIKTL